MNTVSATMPQVGETALTPASAIVEARHTLDAAHDTISRIEQNWLGKYQGPVPVGVGDPAAPSVESVIYDVRGMAGGLVTRLAELEAALGRIG